jgi:hypothetical protein
MKRLQMYKITCNQSNCSEFEGFSWFVFKFKEYVVFFNFWSILKKCYYFLIFPLDVDCVTDFHMDCKWKVSEAIFLMFYDNFLKEAGPCIKRTPCFTSGKNQKKILALCMLIKWSHKC